MPRSLRWRKTVVPAVLDLSVIILPVAIAVIVGKWPEDVAKAHFRIAASLDAVSWPATAFWSACALAFVAAAINVGRTRLEAKKAEDLALIRDHAIALQPVVDSMTAVCRDAMAKYGKPHPDAALRLMLDALAQVAWFYDGKPAARYASNVMLYVPAERADEGQFLRLSFWDGQRTELRGMLDLQRDWSTAMGTTAARDKMLTPLALPIPKEEKRGGKHRVLPGAPQAFIRRDSEFKQDSADLVRWCEEYGDFSPNVRDELKLYLATPAGKATRSLVSISIIHPSRAHGDPIGVVNIHRNLPGMLGKKAATFILATGPIQGFIAEILAKKLARQQV
jgi:hypothetical protein